MLIPLQPLSRRLLLAGAAVSAWRSSQAAPVTLPTPVSLPDELAQALKKGSPLLVLVSLEGCPFCRVARENYLGPMREQQGLDVVQVDMRSSRTIKGFKGETLTQDELIRAWRIKVAPSVLFFGRGGVEVVERLVGGYIPDFYGAYLDDRLRLARAALRS
ncbi:thioredoxin fold domain-containing protein [Rhodoferax ferrireducens]|uniref:thioredoxin fold domain-containing protein n=1 Tax=Rhodoferax ferrireducens TaxID=192843 RepID=UPI001E4AC4BE|nr:thioredoxin fold domain-containing protein [Rhodoferax ferrireducens]